MRDMRGVFSGLDWSQAPEFRVGENGRDQVHVWIEPTHDGHRRTGRDANNGSAGEGNGQPEYLGGFMSPDDLPESTGNGHPEAPQTPVVNPEPDQVFVDARSIRISAKDQGGRMWESAIWGPQGQSQPWAPTVSTTGAADRRHPTHVMELRNLQRVLSQHYRRAS